MSYRAAMLTGLRTLDLVDLPEPTLESGEILVQVRSVNVCHTDFKKWDDASLSALLQQTPLILGHEISGRVIGIHADVRDVAIGDAVAIDPILPCGACRACRGGETDECDDLGGVGAAAGTPARNAALFATRGIGGGFAELLKIPAHAAIKMPADMPFAVGSLIEPLADVMHSIRIAGDVHGKRCAVFGLGPMGVLHVQALRFAGATVVGVDPRSDRCDAALHLGADVTAGPDSDRIGEISAAFITAGGGALVPATETALGHLKSHGVVVLFASAPAGARLTVDPNRLHYKRQRVAGVVGFERSDATSAIELLSTGAIDVARVRSPSLTLEQVQTGFEVLTAPGVLKPGIDLPG